LKGEGSDETVQEDADEDSDVPEVIETMMEYLFKALQDRVKSYSHVTRVVD